MTAKGQRTEPVAGLDHGVTAVRPRRLTFRLPEELGVLAALLLLVVVVLCILVPDVATRTNHGPYPGT